jgi:hypothetical protein
MIPVFIESEPPQWKFTYYSKALQPGLLLGAFLGDVFNKQPQFVGDILLAIGDIYPEEVNIDLMALEDFGEFTYIPYIREVIHFIEIVDHLGNHMRFWCPQPVWEKINTVTPQDTITFTQPAYEQSNSGKSHNKSDFVKDL